MAKWLARCFVWKTPHVCAPAGIQSSHDLTWLLETKDAYGGMGGDKHSTTAFARQHASPALPMPTPRSCGSTRYASARFAISGERQHVVPVQVRATPHKSALRSRLRPPSAALTQKSRQCQQARGSDAFWRGREDARLDNWLHRRHPWH